MSDESPDESPTQVVATQAAPAEVKPGYKTTEFWLSSIAVLLGLVMASGAVGSGGLAAQIIGGCLSLLGTLGYTASRTNVKAGQ
jgi:hypothetical protein